MRNQTEQNRNLTNFHLRTVSEKISGDQRDQRMISGSAEISGTLEQLAQSIGVNAPELREKHRLMAMIVKAQKLSQAALAKRVGVTQSRIAQIESGIGTAKVSFDILLNILVALGYDYRVMAKKAA